MNILEHQAKEILKEYGILTPKGETSVNSAEAQFIAKKIGCPVIVKAQIRAGGRSKGRIKGSKLSGIEQAKTPIEADKIAFEMFGNRLITSQTSPEGVLVNKVLVEEKISDIVKEFYVAISIDKDCPVIVVSEFGGVDIETIPEEKISKYYINVLDDFQDSQKRVLAYNPNIDPALFVEIIYPLYQIFREKDCLLVEINPLALTRDNKFVALDAKIKIDDNALFRHPKIKAMRAFENPLEEQAAKCGLDYVQLKGDIGCIGNGAGLTMGAVDEISTAGGEPGAFLDVGGGASPEQIKCALRILLSDPKIKVIFINIFAGIFRVDIFASTLIQFVKENKIEIPLVLRIQGNKDKQGRKILRDSGLSDLRFFEVESMLDGVKKAVELAKEAKEK